jgi:hypothetical protein
MEHHSSVKSKRLQFNFPHIPLYKDISVYEIGVRDTCYLFTQDPTLQIHI